MYPAHWASGERAASGPLLSVGLDRRHPGVAQPEVGVWDTWLEDRDAETARLSERVDGDRVCREHWS